MTSSTSTSRASAPIMSRIYISHKLRLKNPSTSRLNFNESLGCDANEIAVAKLSAATPVNITYNFTTAARRLYIPSDEGENKRKIFDDRVEIYARHQPLDSQPIS